MSSSPSLFQFVLQAHVRQQITKELFLNEEHFEQKKKTAIIEDLSKPSELTMLLFQMCHSFD